LKFDRDNRSLDIEPFGRSEREQCKASERYRECEALSRNREGAQVVLVSVATFDQLRRAYPNYYADTLAFIELLKETTGESFP
jgi:hypothetical protein